MQHFRKFSSIGFTILFSALCVMSLPVNAADISLYAIYKRQIFAQTSEADASPACCANVFNAVVELTDSNSVTEAFLTAPDGKQTPLSLMYEQEFLPHRWILYIAAAFPSREALEGTFGKGNYTLSMFGAKDGVMSATLDLSGDTYPAHAPHIRNFGEAQAVDASKDFALHWEPLKDGTTNDCCFVLLNKASDGSALSNTTLLEQPNHLNGKASSIVIPAGSLAPGQEYDVYVRFDKVVSTDTNSYPGVLGRASYAKGTHFTLKTIPNETKQAGN